MDHAIEAEDSRSDAGDSGYSDTLVSTESLRTSVYAYEEENGRTCKSTARKIVLPMQDNHE